MANFSAIIIVTDCETGGLTEKNPLIECSICPLTSKLEELDEYSTGIIAPYNQDLKYEETALQVNGVSMPQIMAGRDSKQVVEELCQLLSKYKIGREKPIFAAHNAKFDLQFMNEFFKFHKKDFMEFINNELIIDTVYWSKLKYIESVNYKLSTCLSNAGIETDSQHRALVDAKATRELVKRFITDLRSEGVSSISGERYRNKFEF